VDSLPFRSVLSLPLVLETEEDLVEQVKVQQVSRPWFLIAKLEVDIFGWVKPLSVLFSNTVVISNV